MSKKTVIALGILVLAVLLAGVNHPVRAATEYDVDVNNKNSFTITLTFVGPEILQFDLAPGKTTIELQTGAWQHSYYGCGQLNFGNYTVKTKNNAIDIESCAAPKTSAVNPKAKLLVVKNQTATSFPINFVGLENNTDYAFTLSPLGNKLYLLPGLYFYHYYACSGLHTGNIRVKSTGAEMTIQDCSSSADGDALTNTLVTFKVKNNTGGTLYVQLNGQFDYLFSVTGSSALLTVERGYYSYILYGCGRTFSGEEQITQFTFIKTVVCTNVSQ